MVIFVLNIVKMAKALRYGTEKRKTYKKVSLKDSFHSDKDIDKIYDDLLQTCQWKFKILKSRYYKIKETISPEKAKLFLENIKRIESLRHFSLPEIIPSIDYQTTPLNYDTDFNNISFNLNTVYAFLTNTSVNVEMKNDTLQVIKRNNKYLIFDDFKDLSVFSWEDRLYKASANPNNENLQIIKIIKISNPWDLPSSHKFCYIKTGGFGYGTFFLKRKKIPTKTNQFLTDKPIKLISEDKVSSSTWLSKDIIDNLINDVDINAVNESDINELENAQETSIINKTEESALNSENFNNIYFNPKSPTEIDHFVQISFNKK